MIKNTNGFLLQTDLEEQLNSFHVFLTKNFHFILIFVKNCFNFCAKMSPKRRKMFILGATVSCLVG